MHIIFLDLIPDEEYMLQFRQLISPELASRVLEW